MQGEWVVKISKTKILSGLPLMLTMALLACPDSAVASTTPAQCCLRGTTHALANLSRLGTDGDQKFFTVQGAPPNIMFLLDNSGSMIDLPQSPSQVGSSG